MIQALISPVLVLSFHGLGLGLGSVLVLGLVDRVEGFEVSGLKALGFSLGFNAFRV